jgi:hypothetical protein
MSWLYWHTGEAQVECICYCHKSVMIPLWNMANCNYHISLQSICINKVDGGCSPIYGTCSGSMSATVDNTILCTPHPYSCCDSYVLGNGLIPIGWHHALITQPFIHFRPAVSFIMKITTAVCAETIDQLRHNAVRSWKPKLYIINTGCKNLIAGKHSLNFHHPSMFWKYAGSVKILNIISHY